jgi:hypothetical protein
MVVGNMHGRSITSRSQLPAIPNIEGCTEDGKVIDCPVFDTQAQAAHRELASRGLREVIAEWEIENGAYTEAELATARARLRW